MKRRMAVRGKGRLRVKIHNHNVCFPIQRQVRFLGEASLGHARNVEEARWLGKDGELIGLKSWWGERAWGVVR